MTVSATPPQHVPRMVRQVRASTSGRLSEIPKTNGSNPPDPSAADTHPFRETAPVVQAGFS